MTLPLPGLLDPPACADADGPRFPATRAQALARLAAFLPRAGRAYAARRNEDAGPLAEGTTSRLSPAIRRRLLSEEEVALAAWAQHGPAAEKFVHEVCWRTYFRGWLELRPAVWRRYLAQLEADTARLGSDPELARAYARAVRGDTGIDAFDAWAAELPAKGWLHNHARMNFASIWIFTLGLPWTLGAAWFFRHLLDACPASNTLSWRWVAGLHTPGKTYLARAGTIRANAGGRFRVEAALAGDAPALSEPPVPGPGRPPQGERPGALRSGLFVTTEDLAPEQHDLGEADIVAIAAVERIGGDPAAPKRAHAEAGLADALTRAADHWGIAPDRLDGLAPLRALIAWAERHRLEQVVTPHAPVGPVADLLAAVRPHLAAAGIRLVQPLRAWDAQAWPHATGGFFRFRQAIPELIEAARRRTG